MIIRGVNDPVVVKRGSCDVRLLLIMRDVSKNTETEPEIQKKNRNTVGLFVYSCPVM